MKNDEYVFDDFFQRLIELAEELNMMIENRKAE